MVVFGRNRRWREEYWAALAEKAYAKLCGCYAVLEGGSAADALVDLTGGVALTVDLRSAALARDALAAQLARAQAGAGRYLVGCARGARGAWRGIVPGHAYQVLRVLHAVPLAGGAGASVDLVHVRSPWARSPWTGAWAPASPAWHTVEPSASVQLGAVRAAADADGSFFMDAGDLCAAFDTLCLCRTDLAGCRTAAVRGAWAPGSSAGGSRDCPTWACNPQYRVTVDRPAHVFVVVSQADTRYAFSAGAAASSETTTPLGQPLEMGFSVYARCTEGKRVVCPEGLERHGVLCTHAALAAMRERALPVRLTPEDGPVVVVPALASPGVAGRFVLTVVATSPPDARVHIAPVAEWAHTRVCRGRWALPRCGGCFRGGDDDEGWRRNPTYVLRAEGDVVLTLTTADTSTATVASAPSVGLYVLAEGRVAAQSAHFAQRVALTVDAADATQCRILCATFHPGVVADFVLSVYSEKPFDISPDDDDDDDDEDYRDYF